MSDNLRISHGVIPHGYLAKYKGFNMQLRIIVFIAVLACTYATSTQAQVREGLVRMPAEVGAEPSKDINDLILREAQPVWIPTHSSFLSRLYVEGTVGTSFFRRMNSFTHHMLRPNRNYREPVDSFTLNNFRPGLIFGGEIGLTHNSKTLGVRFGLAYHHLSTQCGVLTLNYPNSHTVGETGNIRQSCGADRYLLPHTLNVQSITGNGYWDILPHLSLRPFVGFGAGAAQARMPRRTMGADSDPYFVNQRAPIFMVHVGARFQLTDWVYGSIKGSYTMLPQLDYVLPGGTISNTDRTTPGGGGRNSLPTRPNSLIPRIEGSFNTLYIPTVTVSFGIKI